MPKVSIVLGRRTLNVVELDRPKVTIGRSPETDIPIDNVSVSRQHAEIFRTENGWMVRDSNSSNGTFLNGERLTQPRPLKRGDEISIGKFSIFFDRVLGEGESSRTHGSLGGAPTESSPSPAPAEAPSEPAPEPVRQEPRRPPSDAPVGGTRFIKPDEIDQLRQASAERRKAKVTWSAGGEEGEKPMPETGCLLVGKSELCDLRTPKGPKQHLLLSRLGENQWEVRNLSWWHGMTVNGTKRPRAGLSDGDTVEIAGLTLTYTAAVD